MVHFPSLLSKLGIQKFLIEDSSMSDKVVPGTLSLTGHLKKFFFNLFSIGGELLYHIVLAPAIQQHESAIGIYVCPFPLEPPSHPPPHATRSGLSQSTMLCGVAQLTSIRQMSGQVSRGSAGEYQADEPADRKSTRLNSSHTTVSRMPSSA